MKNQFYAVILGLAVIVLFNAGQTYAQSREGLRVDVPFAFTANDKSFPAGTYVLDSASDSRIVWKLYGDDLNAGRVFLLSSSLSGTPAGSVRLTFHRYGNENFLSGFKTSSYQVELPTSHREKYVRQSTGGSAIYQLVTTEAVSAR
ncbi:MAG: hypothetical protein HOP17_02880 [Acidobacteria bacterium]|nr:hypothetical protein [Acidobacteriota bacterium]